MLGKLEEKVFDKDFGADCDQDDASQQFGADLVGNATSEPYAEKESCHRE